MMSIKEVKEALEEAIKERVAEKIHDMDWSDVLWAYTLDIDDDIEEIIDECADYGLEALVDDMKEDVIRAAVGECFAQLLRGQTETPF